MLINAWFSICSTYCIFYQFLVYLDAKSSFNDDACKIIKGNRVLAVAKEHYFIYKISTKSDNSDNAVANIVSENHLTLRHRRLGHRDANEIKKLETKNLVTGLKLKGKHDKNVKCECCTKGKLLEKPDPKATSYRAKAPLEIIHNDICGPKKCESLGGKIYFITFTDDFSCYTTIYLISTKEKAVQKLKEFIAMTLNKFGKKPQVFRTDNGGEYVNKETEDFLANQGIKSMKPQCQILHGRMVSQKEKTGL